MLCFITKDMPINSIDGNCKAVEPYKLIVKALLQLFTRGIHSGFLKLATSQCMVCINTALVYVCTIQ